MKGKRGTVIVEAAIFVPIFLAAVLTLAFLVRIIAIQETAVYLLCDEARGYAALCGGIEEGERWGRTDGAKSTGYDFLRKGGKRALRYSCSEKVTGRLREEWGKNLASADISQWREGETERGITRLVRVRLDYQVRIPVPFSPVRGMNGRESLTFREFVGERSSGEPMGFARMEREEDGDSVWVFPRAGERYHRRSCGVIAVEPTACILSPAVRRRYSPCTLCKPGELADGSVVFCFSKTGKGFHRRSCSLVERFVTEMSREEAERRGYTPCLKCGGGKG